MAAEKEAVGLSRVHMYEYWQTMCEDRVVLCAREKDGSSEGKPCIREE